MKSILRITSSIKERNHNNIMKKRILAAVVCTAVVLSLTGCAGKETSTPVSSPAQSQSSGTSSSGNSSDPPKTESGSSNASSTAGTSDMVSSANGESSSPVNESSAPTVSSTESSSATENSTTTESGNNSAPESAVSNASVYDFEFSIDGEIYKFPFMYSDLIAKGWKNSRGDENATLKSNQYAIGYEVEKDDISIRIQPLNKTDKEIAVKDANIGKVTLDMDDLKSDSHDIKYGNIVLGKSTMADVKAAFGEPDDSYDSDKYPTITYKKEIYVSVEFGFDNTNGGVLQEIDIRNFN